MGFIHAGSNKVIREGKYAVSKKEYPGKSYPPYACGAGYILGHSIVEYAERKLLDGTLKTLSMEDVSVGVWVASAKKSGIPVNYTHSWSFHWRDGRRRCGKDAVIAHPLKDPALMVCMWKKEQRGMENICC
mmetsp:Transcript_5932/g.8869  ORF Transcript_5932/g.8869 Transcript_5932/m.8869 type:complete len:131 (+) Transcript_5932:1507-1899(+)